MAYVKADLSREVLGELYSLASGQTPNAEDVTWVEQRINAVLASLASRNMYYLADADESIPDDAFNALVVCVAEAAAPKFGRPRNYQAIAQAENELRLVYRMMNAPGPKLRVDSALMPRRTDGIF
jgi:hypothetical protein